ncbi:hypothetical protein [Streptomyces luteogriseus]|uniref:hypothetical protein n=1 Tax=Streptomyces luteogriseus TaxID=68233 RepID=UPI0037FA058C
MLEDAGVETPAAQHDGPVARPLRVRKMQTKLHRSTAADPGCRFDDLYHLVCDRRYLAVAWDRVVGNTGARTAGVNRATVRPITERVGVEVLLDQLR